MIRGLLARFFSARAVASEVQRETIGSRGYPGAVDTGDDYRRMLFVARTLAVFLFFSVSANVASGAALFLLIPLQKVQPWLMKEEPESSRIVELKPMRERSEAIDRAMQLWVIRYVTNRYTIVGEAEAVRSAWRWAERASSAGVWESFRQNHAARLGDLIDRGLLQRIRVISAVPKTRPNERQQGVYELVYEQITYQNDTAIERRRYHAVVVFTITPREATAAVANELDEALLFGFLVTQFNREEVAG